MLRSAAVILSLVAAVAAAASLEGARQVRQSAGPERPRQDARAPQPSAGDEVPVPVDEARAKRLYVSNRPEDHALNRDFDRDTRDRMAVETRYADASRGAMEFRTVTYQSRADGLEIPAYLFSPLTTRGPGGHAAMVWVHGGVHGKWDLNMFPFVREATERGYVIICPQYRGSIGYGEKHHNAIDYGGYEVDDVMSAVEYLKTLPHVDAGRIGIMGWSHGGYIALFSVFRETTPFRAAAAMVPVTNLVFRLSYKGPSYQHQFATQSRIQGLPFEKRALYIERSPLYHVDKLRTPLLVHVATNDTDVDFVENQQIVDALRSRKPDLAETRVYVDPPPGAAGGGHTFNRRTNMKTLEREDTPEQRDSWNRVWTFFEWHLRPYHGANAKAAGG